MDAQKDLIDNLTGVKIPNPMEDDHIKLEIKPYGRFWVKHELIEIPRELKVDLETEKAMKASLTKQR